MSTWRQTLTRVKIPNRGNLIAASFRGVPFFVESTERSGGRRTVNHEFPLRDDPYIEDLGRKARQFKFEGYVLGNDYIAQKNRLLSALEDETGPGELVHPYYGRKRGICSTLGVHESIADGGFAKFSIEFLETPNQSISPTETVDHAGQVDGAADLATSAANEDFQAGYNIHDQPAFAVQSLANDLAGRTRALRTAMRRVTSLTQEIAKLEQYTQNLIDNAVTLARTPADIMKSFVGVLDSMADTILLSPRQVMRSLGEAYTLPPPPVAFGTTGTRVRERANQQALLNALRQVLAIEAARLIVTVPYATLEDATADAAIVLAQLDEQAILAGDATYPAIIQLRATVASAVPGDSALARVLTLERRSSIPSLLLSYQLYGTVDEEADLVARNNPQHPGFLLGSLKALSNA